MANKELLRAAIDHSGLKIGYIADQMGISRPTLYKRLENPETLTGREAKILSKLLRLSENDRSRILFG